MAGDAPRYTFDLIARYGLSCNVMRNGWIHAATDRGLADARDRVRQWQALGADVSFLDANTVKARLGGGNYAGALMDMRGGGLHPLAYTQGLARAAHDRGVKIFEQSEACSWERARNGDFMVHTEHG